MKVVITGLGPITPYGYGIKALWEGLFSAKANTSYLPPKDQISISPKILKRLDPLTVHALHACELAFKDSNCPHPPEKTGCFAGIHYGGWQSFETLLENFKKTGYKGIRPATVLAALQVATQGNASALFQILGDCKTFSSGTASSAHALYHAYQLIQTGELEVALVCSSELPFSPLAQDYLKKHLPFDSSSRPYSGRLQQGIAHAEGACAIVIESYEHALRRNAKIYAVLNSVKTNCEQDPFSAVALKHLLPSHTDVLFPEASGIPLIDAAEKDAYPKIPLSSSKTHFGHSLSCSFLIDLVTACLSIKNQKAASFFPKNHRWDISIPTLPHPQKIEHTTLVSRTYDGINTVSTITANK
jgi:3-oxoacyl-[acyl-carrier-protein] synthase II